MVNVHEVNTTSGFHRMENGAALAEGSRESSGSGRKQVAGDGTIETGNSNSGNKFEQKIEASSAKMYFHYYGQLLHQQNMLQDYIRTGTYFSAVLENLPDFQGKVVVDVGAGSGILSLFAAQAGARMVYAIEASGMAEYAKKLINGNPQLRERITVVHGKVEEVSLPEKADVLISEPMGTLLVNERMLESYIISRDRFLRPGGKMFPSLGRIHLAPFSDEYLYAEIVNKAMFWQQKGFYGVDLTPLHSDALDGCFSQPVVDAFDPKILLSPSITHTIDFLSKKEEELFEIDIPLSFRATIPGRVHGIACWFDVFFNGSVVPRWLTTAPGSPSTHWYQIRCLLPQPIHVMAGQQMTGRLLLKAHASQSYNIHLTLSAMASGPNGVPINQPLQTSTAKLDLKEPYYRMSQTTAAAAAYAWVQEQHQQQPQTTQQLQQPTFSQQQVPLGLEQGGTSQQMQMMEQYQQLQLQQQQQQSQLMGLLQQQQLLQHQQMMAVPAPAREERTSFQPFVQHHHQQQQQQQ